MNRISNIIQESMTLHSPDRDLKGKRPIINVKWEIFIQLLLDKANQILFDRNINKEYRINECDKGIIYQLYLYATYNSLCKYDLNKGILLMGKVGVGKTILLKAFLDIFNDRRLSMKRVAFFTTTEFVNRMAHDKTVMTDNSKKPLYLDDLGKEPSEIAHYGSKIRPIADLLSLRYDNGTITFGTSNYNLESLGKHYGNYIGDRLKEMFTPITMKGESKRGLSL